MYDAKGKAIAGSQIGELSLDNQAPAELTQALGLSMEGGFRSADAGGKKHWLAYQKSAIYGWTATVAVPEDMLVAELAKDLWLQLGGAVVLLLAGLALANRIGRGIAAPIQALVEPALALGRGEALSIPPLHLREADQVAGGYFERIGKTEDGGERRALFCSLKRTDMAAFSPGPFGKLILSKGRNRGATAVPRCT